MRSKLFDVISNSLHFLAGARKPQHLSTIGAAGPAAREGPETSGGLYVSICFKKLKWKPLRTFRMTPSNKPQQNGTGVVHLLQRLYRLPAKLHCAFRFPAQDAVITLMAAQQPLFGISSCFGDSIAARHQYECIFRIRQASIIAKPLFCIFRHR